jgi:hypothetical protein
MDGSYNVDDWNTRDTSAIEAAVLRKAADKLFGGEHHSSWTIRYILNQEADRIEQED